MDEGLREQALEWFVRADREIETAQLLYDSRKGGNMAYLR